MTGNGIRRICIFITSMAIVVALVLSSTVVFAEEPNSHKSSQKITTALNLYGLAPGSKFTLKVKAKTPLTFRSSNPAVATVSKKGLVKAKKAGKTTVTITANASTEYAKAQKKVTIRVTDWKKASGQMIHAASDRDGKPGDSSGNETKVTGYQFENGSSSYGYCFLIRATDPYVADLAATAVEYIVRNPSFGYKSHNPKNQKTVYARSSIYRVVKGVTGKNPTRAKLKKIKSIKKKADTSCTPTLLAGYWLYYDMSSQMSLKFIGEYKNRAYKYFCGSVNVEAHQLEKAINKVNREYLAKGKPKPFVIIYIPKNKRASFFSRSNMKKNLKRGDILCAVPNPYRGGHTVMIR